MPAKKGKPSGNKEGLGGRPRKYTTAEIEKYAEEFKLWLSDSRHVWFKDFALDNDLDPDYLSIWAEENEKFLGVYKVAKHRQESRLINGGLMNVYNGSIVKLVLANAHGWLDNKSESKLTGDAVNPLAFIIQNVDGSTKELVNET
ncbi:MAG TPA: terminase small subunit [Candidatus Saccharimonadia bacterium]|nr:terminase small subunit [Candidatus Saccharimonadia bacterium]